MAAEYSFSIEKGTAFVISFEYQDDSNNPINLTNWCARLRWKDNNNNIKTFTTNVRNSQYEFSLEPLFGRIILKIPAAETAQYNFASAVYDLELQEPNDLYSGGGKKVFRILQGNITTIERNVPEGSAFSCSFDQQDDCGTCE
jgi:hypothetical protein